MALMALMGLLAVLGVAAIAPPRTPAAAQQAATPAAPAAPLHVLAIAEGALPAPGADLVWLAQRGALPCDGLRDGLTPPPDPCARAPRDPLCDGFGRG